MNNDWTPDECWALYIDNMDGETMSMIAEKEPLIKRAMTVEDVFIKNEEERRLYELREKGRHDFNNAIITAEKRGRIDGKEEGREEMAKEIARNLLANGVSPDIIAKSAGLPLDKIQALMN